MTALVAPLSPQFGANAGEWFIFRTLGLTADLLPVVSNPAATISPSSSIKTENKGKVPSRYNAHGHISGIPEWTTHAATTEEVDLWQQHPDHGICVQTRTVRALDVDVTDAALAQEIATVIAAHFSGELPRRQRFNSPKFLVPFRMPGDFKKRVIHTCVGKIEFLGNGQQFIAAGTHPSGARYEWSEPPFVIAERSSDEFETLWATLAQRFGVERAPSVRATAVTAPWVEAARRAGYAATDTWFELLAPEQKAAEMRAIAATWTAAQATNREEWFKCIRSIADAVDRGLDRETGVDIATEFSQRSTDAVDGRDAIEAKMFERGTKSSIYAAATLAQKTAQCRTLPPAVPAMPVLLDATAQVPAPVAPLGLRVTRNGIIPDEENVRLILTRDPNLQGIVRFDEFSGDMILARPITSDQSVVCERGIPRPWSDADTVTLQTYIQRSILPRLGRDKIEAVIAAQARHNCAFHPVRDYLQSVTWDGTPRLNTWLRDYMGADSQPDAYLAAVGAAWLIAAVARIFEPGCQADSALVLEGAQGIRKSTALRTLAGDKYFSDSLPADLAHKDARDHLRGKWIIELAELAQFRRAEIETVKAFISRRYEQYRPSYGHHEVKFPRQCVFAGSTNSDEYLVDKTGNRRFQGVACTRVNLEALARDRDQLWAEAVARYRSGEKWHLTGVVEELAAAEAQARIAHDPWTSRVAEIVANPQWVPTPDVAPGEVMTWMNLQASDRHDRNAGRVGQILRNLGWQKGRRERTRGQLYTRPPGAPLPPRVVPPPTGAGWRHVDPATVGFGGCPLPPGAIPVKL